MGRYINFLIKNDFHECCDFKKAKEYATVVFNQLKPEWVKMPYIDGNSSAFINADEESNDGKCNQMLITGTSHPILHFRLSDFEEMRIVPDSPPRH